MLTEKGKRGDSVVSPRRSSDEWGSDTILRLVVADRSLAASEKSLGDDRGQPHWPMPDKTKGGTAFMNAARERGRGSSAIEKERRREESRSRSGLHSGGAGRQEGEDDDGRKRRTRERRGRKTEEGRRIRRRGEENDGEEEEGEEMRRKEKGYGWLDTWDAEEEEEEDVGEEEQGNGACVGWEGEEKRTCRERGMSTDLGRCAHMLTVRHIHKMK